MPPLSSRQAAMAWLETERTNLTDCIHHAAANRQPAHAMHLAAAMAIFLRRQSYLDQAGTIHQAALTQARDLGDRRGQATALVNLGIVRSLTGTHVEAGRLLEAALVLYRDLDERHGQATALTELGAVRRLTGAYAEAERVLEAALALSRVGWPAHGLCPPRSDRKKTCGQTDSFRGRGRSALPRRSRRWDLGPLRTERSSDRASRLS